jgi:hypothetical protein
MVFNPFLYTILVVMVFNPFLYTILVVMVFNPFLYTILREMQLMKLTHCFFCSLLLIMVNSAAYADAVPENEKANEKAVVHSQASEGSKESQKKDCTGCSNEKASEKKAAANEKAEAHSEAFKEGKELHDSNCTSCHEAMYPMEDDPSAYLYTRENHQIKKWSSLQTQVQACNSQIGAGFFDDEIEAVTTYLNQAFYKFEETAKK